jgi:hypothetical protein
MRGGKSVGGSRERGRSGIVLGIASRSVATVGNQKRLRPATIGRDVKGTNRVGGGRGKVGVLTLEMLQVGVAASKLTATAGHLAAIWALAGAEVVSIIPLNKLPTY